MKNTLVVEELRGDDFLGMLDALKLISIAKSIVLKRGNKRLRGRGQTKLNHAHDHLVNKLLTEDLRTLLWWVLWDYGFYQVYNKDKGYDTYYGNYAKWIREHQPEANYPIGS
jgi:hypothetical protein